MSWIFDKQFATNAVGTQLKNFNGQWQYLNAIRGAYNASEDALGAQKQAAGLQTNAGRIPQEVWREMDAQTKQIMRAPNLTLLEDLLPLSKSLDVGKIVQEYRQASDAGQVQTSISGEVPTFLDKTAYKYDGSVIPVHSVGYGREWRELAGMRSEGFDALIDDNANAARALMDRMANYVYSGDDGVQFKGYDATGVKNSTATKLRDLGAGGASIDLTSATATPQDILNEFKSGRDVLRITNNVRSQVTIYTSRAILSNLERDFDTGNSSNRTILQRVRDLEGIADVKEDATLSGNEYLVVAVDPMYIRPLTGMATGTYAVPRTMFNQKHNFIIANAVGLEIRSDYEGRSGVLYARVA